MLILIVYADVSPPSRLLRLLPLLLFQPELLYREGVYSQPALASLYQ